MKNESQREYLASVWHKQKDNTHTYVCTHIYAYTCRGVCTHTVVWTLSRVVQQTPGPCYLKSKIKAIVPMKASERGRKGHTKRRLNFCFYSNYLLPHCEQNTSSTDTAVCSALTLDCELVRDPVSLVLLTQSLSAPTTVTIWACLRFVL